MKKFWILLLIISMVLAAGCAKEQPEAATQAPTTEQTVPETTLPPETTEETVPVPDTVPGTARVDRTPAVIYIANRGDSVKILGEFDENHYTVQTELAQGLIRKDFVRWEQESPYEVWTAYAYYNAEMYDNPYLMGEPVRKLSTNTKVEVLDDLGYCYVVQVDEVVGYISVSRVSKWPFSSGSGKDNGGSGGSGGSSGGADGGDITLKDPNGPSLMLVSSSNNIISGKALVLADGVEIILKYFDRGEDLPVVVDSGYAEMKEGFYLIYLDGQYAYVEKQLVNLDIKDPYEVWDGFSKYNAVFYDNYRLAGNPVKQLTTNTQIHVVYALENCYMVEIDGVTGFMAKDMVSEHRIQTGGGNKDSGGGSSGGGGGGGEWTPPAM